MRLQTYLDQACSTAGPVIEFPDIGTHSLTSGTVNSYTYDTETIYFLRGAVALSGITTAPAKLFCQYTSDTNLQLYIKPKTGPSFVRLNVKCGERSVIDPTFTPANEYRYQCIVEIYNLNGSQTWDSASSGGSNISADAQYNFYTARVISDGRAYICMFYYTTGNYVSGFFADEKLFDASLQPRTASRTPTSSPAGHYGTGVTTPGNMTYSDAPAAWSMINATEHGLRVYNVYPINMEYLYRRLWSKDVWQRFTNSRYSPISGILAYHRLPVGVHNTYSVSKISICGQEYQVGDDLNKVGIVDTDNGLLPVECDNNIPKEYGSELPIPEYQGGFLDYAPYCSAVLHLPYIGNVPIDMNTISGGSIGVRYWIDITSGNCMAHVKTTDRNGSSVIIGEYTGNCCYKYPVTGNDQGGTAVLGAAAGAATAGLVGLVSGGAMTASKVAAGLVGAAGGIAQAEMNADHHLQQVGSWPANSAALCDPRVYLIVTRPDFLSPDYYEQLKGYPAAEGRTVGSYTGLLSGTVHADGISGLTDNEKLAIEAAFQKGVIINVPGD